MAQKKKLSGMLNGATAIPRAEIAKKEPKKLSGMLTYYTPTQNRGGLAGGLEYLGASVLAGAGGVVEGTLDLIGGGIAALTGNKAYAEYLFENNVVGDWHKRIEDGYNPNGAIKFAGDVTTGLGQSATMLIPYVGVPLFIAGVSGQGVSGAVEKTGELGAKEWIYGGLSGAAEGALEYFVGQAGTALATVGKKAGKSITAKIASNVAKEWAASAAWKGVAKNMLTSASGEFVEEFLAEYIDTWLLRMTGVDKEATTDLRQAAYAGLVGFASGLAMGGITSGIDSSRSYITGRRVSDAGNADTLIKTADKMITDAKIGKDSVVDNTIKQLRNSVEMYKKAENKGSDAALIYLGEVKSYMAAVETIHAVRSSAARLTTVNEAQATAYAKAMSYFDGNAEVSKNYTAQDWFNNKNDIRTRYAAMGWAGAFLSDSRAEVETAAFNQAIAADMEGRKVGKPAVADIAGAEWDGSDATFYVGDANRREGAPSEGDYLRIAKDAKGGYYMAVGNNAEGARGFAGRTENEVRELFNGYRDAVVEGRTKRAAEAEISARAAEARARADAMNAPESFATKSDKRGAQRLADKLTAEAEAAKGAIPDTDALRDEINAGSGRIAKNRYTQAQTDAARKAVKDFDMLDTDTKAKILRWIESTEGKGVDADVVSAVASIMRIREGLQVIYADTKEGVAGFHDEIKKADRNLIVLSSKNDLDLLRETIAHELGHEVENAEGFEEIKKAAVKATKEADLKEWEELYKKNFPNMTPEEIKNEVAMKALGRRLATPRFLNRYANKSTLRRLVDAGKQLIEYLRADDAGKLAIDETNKLIEMMDRAIMGVNVQGEGKSAGKTQKYVFNMVFDSSEADGDIPDNRVLKSTTQYSITEAPRLAENTEKRNEKDGKVKPKTLKSGIESMKLMASLMKPYLSKDGILPPDVVGKTAWKNGSYGRTMENTTLCIRTLTYEYFKDEVAKAVGRPLTVAESLLASQKIYDIATYPQCIYCYVAADRKSYDAFIGEYIADMDKYIKLLKEGGDSDALFKEFLHGREPTNAQKKRWAEWKRIANSGEAYISASDINTRSKRNALIAKGGKAAAQVRDAQRYAQSASWAKTVSDYVAYNGDILKFSPKMIETLNSEYGLRMYSFSDYTPAFIVENMQMVLDASVRGLKVLSYTKDADYVKIFGDSGMAINMSCFARYDSKTGTYVEDSRQGMKWDEVKELRNKHKNAGAVMVVTDDQMLNWALDQDWVDVVIPYHIVKTGTTIAGAYSWRNYTRESADYAGNKTANIYPTEHDNDFNKFRKLVEERGITPRFNEWYVKAVNGEISGDKYMKLVNEVRVPAGELSPVEPKFDIQAALNSFGIDEAGNATPGGYVDNGGYMGNWFKQGVDVKQEIRAVAEDVIAGKTVSDVDYGRQSIREAGGIPKKSYNLTKSEAERAAQDAAEKLDRAKRAEKNAEQIMSEVEKKAFKAEVSRSETIARGRNTHYFPWVDVNREIITLVKPYGIEGKTAREIAFSVHRAFNALNSNKAERKENMVNALVDLMIERADAAENSDGRWRDDNRRSKLRESLNEIYNSTAKKTERQKARERVESAEEFAWRAINGSAIAPLLDRVNQRRFREKTKGILAQDAWKNVVNSAREIRRKYTVNLQKVIEFLNVFYDFATVYAAEAVAYANDPDSQAVAQIYKDATNYNEVLHFVDYKLVSSLKGFREKFTSLAESKWTNEDFETLRLALERLLAMDGRFDKQYTPDGKFGETSDVAEQVMKSLNEKYKGQISNVNIGGIKGLFATVVYNSLEPEAAVRLLEGARGKHILSRMVNSIKHAAEFAKNDERKWLREIEEFKKQNPKWWKEWNEGDVTLNYTLPTFGGETRTTTLTLTKDEGASFYMTTKRAQAQLALGLGRVEIADALDRKGETYRSRLVNGLESEQISQLTSMEKVVRDDFLIKCINAVKIASNEMYKSYSEIDKKYIALLEKFYATISKNEKREMDTRLFGSTNVFEGYYYPISRSSLNRDMDLSSTYHDLDDVSTRGYAFNKSTIEGANTRLTIRGATEVTNRHAKQLAMYKHLTMPLQNLQRLYNYRFGIKTAKTETVRDYMTKYVWKDVDTYLSNYFKDVQGMSRRTANDAASRAFRYLQSGYVKFQLGANLKSLIKQFGSAIGMTSAVDIDVWTRGMLSAKIFSKEAVEDMKKYSKFAENRIDSNEVYYAAGVSGKVGKVSDVLMKHLEWGDTRANLIMWAMAQEAVAKETNHAVGTVENKRLAGKKLDEFIMTVQDTSGAATKSAYARSPQVLVQGFTLFSSAPTKLASRLIVAATELRELRQLKNEGGISDAEMKKLEELEGKTKKVLGKVGGAVLMVALFEALVNIGWGKLGGDDEEDEKFVQTLATEVVSNAVGIIPLAGGFAESLISGYDVSNLYLDVYNDGIASIRNLYTMTANLASGEQVSQQTVLKNLRSVAYFSGQVTGIPIRNINNLITRTLGVVSDTAAYEYDALFYEPSYSADLKKAMEKGDEKLVESIVGLTLRERTGAASSFASDEIVRLTFAGHNAMPRAIPTTVNVDGEDRNVTRRERAAFEKIYSDADSMVIALMATEQYTELSDELRAKAIKVTYDIYHSRAKSEVFGAELSTMAALSYFEDYIDVPTLVAESAYIYGIKGTAEAKRSEIVKAYISGYSREAQAILLYAAGYRSEAVKEAMSELYGRLDADAQKSAKNIFDF